MKFFSNWKKLFKSLIYLFLTLAVLYFLYRNINYNWRQLLEYEFNLNFSLFIFSLVIMLLTLLLLPMSWRVVLKGFNIKLSFTKSYIFMNISQLGKYLPGKLWIFIGQTYYIAKEGKSKTLGFFSTIVQTLISVTSGMTVYFIIHLLIGDTDVLADYWFVFLFVPLFFFAALPSCQRLVLWLISKIREKKTMFVTMPYSSIISAFVLMLLYWLITGLAFYIMARSAYAVSFEILPLMTSAMAIAWVIGFLAFFSPSGLGIREGFLIVILRNAMPLEQAIVISFLSRIWFVLCDLTNGLIAWRLAMRTERTGSG